MILLWGVAEDQPLAAVARVLERSRARVVFVNQREVFSTSVEIGVDYEVEGRVTLGSRTFDLHTVTAAYIRPYETYAVSDCVGSRTNSDWEHAARCDQLLWASADVAPSLIVNRPASMAASISKPYQQGSLVASGFLVPDTLITTDPDAVREFSERHEIVIYKSVGSVRSIVTRLDRKDSDRLKNVVCCPTQFQEYVPGTDYRVHVVGERVFATRVMSTADDYRYAEHEEKPSTSSVQTFIRRSSNIAVISHV